MRLKAATLGILLASTALGSAALTLGRARGAAWIGQPLDLSVAVQLDAGQTASTLCPEADVFHADSRQDASRVQVLVEPTAQPDTVSLRVLSSAVVDEPVVTVYLRAGCNQKSTRRYVLLADYPSEPAAPPSRAAEVVPRPVPSVPAELATVASAATPTKAPQIPAQNPVANPAPKPNAVRKDATVARPTTPKPPTAAPAAPAPKATVPGKARLKLDPLENLAERIKSLESTTTAVPLEEMVKDSQRIQQLQSDVKALLDQAAKNEANLLAMRVRMEQAEADRIPVIWVYGLVALVLLCLAAIALLWSRRTAPSSWHSSLSQADQDTVQKPAPASVLLADLVPPPAEPPPTAVVPASSHTKAEPPSDMDVDVNLMDMDEESFGKLLKPSPTQPVPLIATPDSKPHTLASASNDGHPDFNADSLFDLRQQADFFVKLGKVDDAIEALEQRIRDNSRDSPLVYLDLLRIANQHSLKTDFRQFRDEFEQSFNAKVPEFALFRNEGRSLEEYPSVLRHIVAVWSSSKVLEVLESCILKDPFEKNAEPFDLAAFKDLIALHGIANARAAMRPQVTDDADSSTQHVDLDI